jgi:hypothetical protein
MLFDIDIDVLQVALVSFFLGALPATLLYWCAYPMKKPTIAPATTKLADQDANEIMITLYTYSCSKKNVLHSQSARLPAWFDTGLFYLISS